MSKLIKNRDGNFTHIKNDIFNSGLHAKSIGLFCYLWHLPNDWHFYVDEITTHFKDGKGTVRSALEELQEAGFLRRVQSRDDTSGKFKRFDWELNEAPNKDFAPHADFPLTAKPAPDLPEAVNEPLQSTKETKYEDTKISSSDDDFVNEPAVKNNAITTYEQIWGFPNAIALQDLTKWINDYSDELVTYAIEIAGRNNVQSRGAYKYLDKILTTWSNEQVTTVEQAKKQNEEHNNRIDREYKSRRAYNKPVKREELPDWQSERDNAKPADEDKKKALQEKIKRMQEEHME